MALNLLQLLFLSIRRARLQNSAVLRRYSKTAILKNDAKNVLTLDDVVASRGGIPLIEDGKLIGAVGCSGGTGSQDEVICTAGAAIVNK